MGTPSRGGLRPQLFGRVDELDQINALLDAAFERGSTLVFRGDAGIGKSVLLDAARVAAKERGLRVLSTAGAEAESNLPYAGVHRLLRPLLAGIDELPAPQRSMLLAAFGMAEHDVGDLFLVALGALGLLSAEASRQPVLVTIDDIHWLDSASREVVEFIGRRIEADPIVLLGAVREGHAPEAGVLGLPERLVGPLDSVSAAAVVDARAPALAPGARRRLLDEAAGNPLALVELPTTVDQLDASSELAVMPVSARLESAFVARLRDVPPDTATLLLIFAADAVSSLAEVFAAAELLLERAVTVAALQPAVDAGLATIDATSLHFRHPLVRSAIYQSVTVESRRAAHLALAEVVAGQPDRRVQHRAAAAVGPDEEVAHDLEAMGERALRRGTPLQASAALARAAELSPDASTRARRLLQAAEPAFAAGRADLVRDLVERARREPLSELEGAKATWLSEIFHDASGPMQGDPSRVLHLVDLARGAGRAGDIDLAMALLKAAAMRSWFGGTDPDTARRIVPAVEELGEPPTTARRLATIAVADPLDQGREVAALVHQAGRGGAFDGRNAYFLCQAAHCVGDFEAALRMNAIAVEGLRDQGQLALLAQALVQRAVDSVLVGDFLLAEAAATEGADLSEETGQPIWHASANGSLAAVAGVRGDIEQAEVFLARGLATLAVAGTRAVLGWLQVMRGIVYLSASRYEDAYVELAHTFDPAHPAYHRYDSFMAVGLFAEAAVGCGLLAPARELTRTLAAFAGPSSTMGIRAGLLHARPLLAPDEEAETEYRAALSSSSLVRPFERARLQLAFGMWLRRQRRVLESRDPLRLARSGFDAMNAPTWSERARQELRAAGESSAARERRAWDDLSPQELQIAQLAAAGLSNKEIGQRLYLSHRTVGSHLYHVYPKLGITSRVQLSSALPE